MEQINQHPLIGKTVAFQTDLTSFGTGQVIAINLATERVSMIDDEGQRWNGNMDQIEVEQTIDHRCENNMSQLIEVLRKTAAQWRAVNPQHHDGVVLVWDGAVYGWKNSLRDAVHERPGVYAVDEAGHVFIAEGGDDYNGAKCWVVVSPTA